MTVTFTISGVKNARGKVRGLAFHKNNGSFPENVSLALDQAETPAKEGTVKLVFKNISTSMVAFSFFHDEKGKGKIEKTLLGIPRCGVGASNWSGKGRPSFAKSLVRVSPEMTAELKYF